MSEAYQRRFTLYAQSQGRTPEEQLEHDQQAYPSGRTIGYILWMGQRWREWDFLHPGREVHGPKEQADFDVWLAARAAAGRSNG